MIILNGTVFTPEHFPDGTQRIFNLEIEDNNTILWRYENDEELVTLYFLKRHIDNLKPNSDCILIMPYVPNARMDRVKSDNEVFTLKYFCEIINSLYFDKVYIFDPHSYVSEALLDRVTVMSPEHLIKYAIEDIEGFGIDGGKTWGGKAVIYFPDEGAMKRYCQLKVFGERDIIYGTKDRDWKTGKIRGLRIHDKDGFELKEGADGNKPLEGKVILMVDDIISYGGTMAYSADKLKSLGAMEIYACASHVENSAIDKERSTILSRIDSGEIDEIFTAKSTFTKEYKRITVVDDCYDGDNYIEE